ncbi:MAG: hypothetical protein AAF903_12340 [Pseudomonadota bacterium]
MELINLNGLRRRSMVEWLEWAYQRELPKEGGGADTGVAPGPAGYGNAFGSVTKYGELLAHVQEDRVNRYGLVPLGQDEGPPHPLAVAIGKAVDGLADMDIVRDEDWQPCGDNGPLDLGVHHADVTARAWDLVKRRPLLSLVITHAVLGTRPPCPDVVFKARPVHKNGRPAWFRKTTIAQEGLVGEKHHREIEVDGYNPRARRPYADAYQKTELVPDPAADIAARIERELWGVALFAVGDAVCAAVDGFIDLWATDCPAFDDGGVVLPAVTIVTAPAVNA